MVDLILVHCSRARMLLNLFLVIVDMNWVLCQSEMPCFRGMVLL